MLKPCGKGRPTCKNCSLKLKMTFNDFFFFVCLLLVTRELYDFSRELKKSNIFWYFIALLCMGMRSIDCIRCDLGHCIASGTLVPFLWCPSVLDQVP